MARSEIQDPLDKFRWVVSIDDFTRAGFTSCQTPSMSATTHNYPEGGAHLSPRQIINTVEYLPVTFERGVTSDTSFNKWVTGHFDLVQNSQGFDGGGVLGLNPVASFAGDGESYRKTVSIKHVDRVGQVIVEYILYGAHVVGYKPASDFNSTDDEGFSMEMITVAYDTFDVRYAGITGAAASKLAEAVFDGKV